MHALHRLLISTFLGVLTFSPGLALAEAGWTATPISSPGGAIRVSDMNENGDVVGHFRNTLDQDEAFVWRAGVTQRLGTGGANHSYARGINDVGDVVGEIIYAGISHPAVMRGPQIQVFWNTYGGAWDINNAGTIVGWRTLSSERYGYPVAFADGVFTSVGRAGESFGYARRINQAGDVAGGFGDTDIRPAMHAFFRSAGVVTPIANVEHRGGFDVRYAASSDINELGQVVGTGEANYWPDQQTRLHSVAWLYQNNTLTYLPRLSDYGGERAEAINNVGDIVGASGVEYTVPSGNYAPVTHAVLWRNGEVIDLNSLVPMPAGNPDAFFQRAADINDSGQIVAEDNQGRAWLLSPPASERTAIKARALTKPTLISRP